MAPKSWAVAHPERSAILLALPMRAFMFLTRPLLHVLNNAANACLRLVGVEPVDEVDQGHTSDDLRELLRHSAQAGTIERGSLGCTARRSRADSAQPRRTGGEAREHPTAVGPDATVAQVRDAAQRDRHRRILVHTVSEQPPTHVVHVRYVLGLAGGDTITEVTRPVEVLPATMTVGCAFEQ